MDGQTDGVMDESDLIGCCPTKVERPINLESIIGGIFQNLLVKIFSKLVYFDGMHPS